MGAHLGPRPLGNTPYVPPFPRDPFFNAVSLLLHGDGTNGAQNNTFLDSSTNNFTVTRNGNTTQGTNTPFSQAAGYWSNYFDGSSKLNLAANANLQIAGAPFTIEAWVYPTSLAGSEKIISAQDTGASDGSQYQFRLTSSGQLQYIYWTTSSRGSAASVTTSNTVPLNQWSHVAVCYDGTTLRLFVNGTSGFSGAATMYSNAFATGIGGYSDPPAGDWQSFAFIGNISNFRIVKGTAVYTSNFTPPTIPLTAITNTSLLTCQSNNFKDNSSNNFALTVSGTPSVQPFSPFAPTSAYNTSVNGGSMYFDGAEDYLSLANNSTFLPTGDFTIECWVYLNNLTPYNRLISSGINNSSTNWGLTVLTNGTVIFYIGANTSSSITSNAVLINTWNHIAVSRQSGTLRVFINGVIGFSGTNNASLNNSASVNLVVGADSAGTDGLVKGYISNPRIVNGTAVYTANFTPPTAPLTAITNTQLLLSGTNAGIFDNAAKNNLETVGDAQVSTSVVKYGTGSMSFDGTIDYLQAPKTPQYDFGTGDFTIEAWVYSGVSATQTIIDTRSSDVLGAYIFDISSTNKLDFIYSSSRVTSSASVPLNSWVHVAVTRASGTIRLFINGVLDANTATYTSAINALAFPSIGGGRSTGASDVTGYYFNGYIDDLRITKGIARYTANFTPPTEAFLDQ